MTSLVRNASAAVALLAHRRRAECLLVCVLLGSRLVAARDLSVGLPAAIEHTTGTLTILMTFEHSFSPMAVKEMESEFERVMPSSVRVQWRMLGDVDRGESFNQVVVSKFNGDCEVGNARGRRGKVNRLANSYAERSELLPFSEVDCNAIQAMLSSQADSENIFYLRYLFGRAMGRVLAHEVYHIELNTRLHAAAGIAKPTLAASELFGPKLRFEPDEMRRMSAVLRRAAK